MNVLTWHGAVVRLDTRRNRIVQDPLWLTDAEGSDFSFDAGSVERLRTPLGEMELEPADRPGTVRLRSIHGRYLRAVPTHRDLGFDEEDEMDAWGTFLLLSPNDLADLRYILENRWRVRPSLRLLEKADIRVAPGFGLELGPVSLDLALCLPFASYTRRSPVPGGRSYVPPVSFVIRPGDETAETIELANSQPKNLTPTLHFELVRRRQATPLDVETREAFMRGSNCRLTLPPDEARFMAPPIVMRAQDQETFIRHVGQSRTSPIGFVGGTCQMRREPKRYVALSRGCEGLVFDQDGTWCDIDRLAETPDLPAGFACRDGRIWIDRDAIHEAPKLEGPLLVFYDGQLHRYTNWLTGALPALDAISRQVPRTSRLLLPGTLLAMQRRATTFNHREMMKLLGFGRLPAVESSADVVWVDDVIFMDRPTPESIPADQLKDFRDRVLQPYGGPGEGHKRIYIKRAGAGGLTERHELERFLAVQGFEHVQLEHLTHEAQLRLFQEAAFVVGTHGGGLSNLVFSYPGVKVLELMPDDDFQPDFWTLSNKLGHVYGFLGCPTVGMKGDERLVPDLASFKDLFQTLEAYQT